MDSLKDIKPLVAIPDYSLYILLLGVGFVLLVTIFVIIKVYKYFKHAKKSKKYIANDKLKNIDFQHSKQAAYTITKYAPYLITTKFHQELFEELSSSLSKYKYKKDVPPISQEDREKFHSFLESCDA